MGFDCIVLQHGIAHLLSPVAAMISWSCYHEDEHHNNTVGASLKHCVLSSSCKASFFPLGLHPGVSSLQLRNFRQFIFWLPLFTPLAYRGSESFLSDPQTLPSMRCFDWQVICCCALCCCHGDSVTFGIIYYQWVCFICFLSFLKASKSYFIPVEHFISQCGKWH